MKIGISANLLKYLFRDVYFINGTAYAGKSTMVRLLAERNGGLCCGENYHDALRDAISVAEQPNLSYFSTMSGWQEFLNRTPRQYDCWITGTSEEAAELEILRLVQLAEPGKRIFVDTNISPEILHQISDEAHVAILLAEQSTSVDCFFDRPDAEKQFLLSQIALAENPERTMANFRACLAEINSPEKYRAFENCGFFVLKRDDARTPNETAAILERHFGLEGA